MIKIGIHSDKPDSVRDFYRAMGVFSRLKDLQIVKFDINSLLIFEHYDIIFLSSPVHPQNLNIIQYAKDQGIKIWSDFDDYILDAQPDNYVYDHATAPGNIRNMLAAIRESDVVTVSTDFMKSCLLKYNTNIRVIPNAFNDYCFKMEYNLSKTNLVGWRGAIDGHGNDLVSVIDAFLELDNIFDDNGWLFNFHGKNPWYVTKYIKNWARTGEQPFFQFMEDFRKTNPAIFIYPLADCDFNRSKSQLAWMDATYAGSACVLPEFETYSDLPALKYTTPKEFIDCVLDLIRDETLRKDLYEKSISHLNENYRLSKVNKLRLEIAGEIGS